MSRTGWMIAALAMTACGAFFWGIAGTVDAGFARTRNGFTVAEGGGWYALAVVAGLIVGWFALGSLTDRLPARATALIPATGAAVGAASCLLFGQETRHWVTAFALILTGATVPLAVHLRARATDDGRP